MNFELLNQADGFTVNDFNAFCLYAYKKGASDIYLTTEQKICVKIHGNIVFFVNLIPSTSEIESILSKIHLPTAPLMVQKAPLSFRYTLLEEDESLVRFRVQATGSNNIETSSGCSIVLRTIPDKVPTTDELEVELEILDMFRYGTGIVLVSGPTGSGKSTLIASCIDWYATNYSKVVLCYEDPIEFPLTALEHHKSLVIQTEVTNHVKDYSISKMDALRRAPNLIYFGELRSDETISDALILADTGHLLVSTLHTNSASQTLSRMGDEFESHEERSKLLSAINASRGYVHQRLIPRRGGGRIAIREWLTFNEEIRMKLISELSINGDLTSCLKNFIKIKGHSLLFDVKAKFAKGFIELSDVISIIVEMGDKSDYGDIINLIKSMLSEGILDVDTYDKWMCFMESHNE